METLNIFSTKFNTKTTFLVTGTKPTEPSQVKKKEDSKSNNSAPLLLSMSALSAIAIATISIRKFKKAQKIKAEYLDPALTKFIKKLPENIIKKINLIKSGFDITSLRFDEGSTKSAKDFRKMDFLFAFKKIGLKNSPQTPAVVNIFDLPSEKLKNMSKIFALRYDADLSFRTYVPNKADEFIQSLEEFSRKSKVNFENTQQHSFLHISNADDFLNDLNKDKNLLTKFNKLIEENPKNSLTYLFDTQKELAGINNIKLNFDSYLDSKKVTQALETFEDKNRLKIYDKASKLNHHVLNYLGHNNLLEFSNILSSKKSMMLVDNCDNQTLNKIILKIVEKTEDQIQTIDFSSKPLSETINQLLTSIENSDMTYKLTGKKTFLQIQNSQEALKLVDKNSPEYTQLIDFLNKYDKNQSTILITNEPNFISSLPLKREYYRFECIKNAQITEDLSILNQKILNKMQKNDFSNIDEKQFIRDFVHPLCRERIGLDEAKPVSNGILLYGSVDKANITIEAIKNSLDIYYKKLKFDGLNSKKQFEELVQQLKESLKNFEKDRKRTIIELENLDEILTNQNTAENIRLIGKFKNFIEHVSKNYHATILTKTQKPLDTFEPASIAGQRFEIQYEIQ